MALTAFALNIAANAIVERTVTIHLHTGNPGATGLANRVTGGAYAGRDVAANGWSGAQNGDVNNVADIAYPQSTSDWGRITHVTLFAGTDYMGFGVLSSPINVGNRTTFTIPAQALTINGSSS